MPDLPEPPEIPEDLREQLTRTTASFDAHSLNLEAWAKMAGSFYSALWENLSPEMAQRVMLEWAHVYFAELYAQATQDAPTEED